MSLSTYEKKFRSSYMYYDFKDVLILPKNSDLNSRSEVNLIRKIRFENGVEWEGIPIIAANMTTVGTLDVYKVLSKYKIITALHKFHTLDMLNEYNRINSDSQLNPDYFMISTGISDADYDNLNTILDEFECKFILIDIANGYINKFKDFCKKVREKYPNKVIVAGNVCTKEGVEELINLDIDIIKSGIGGGCFRGDTRILMSNGTYKNISEIEKGEYVINKNGKPVKVLNKINKGIRNIINLITNNWHENTYVTNDHNYWIGDLSTSNDKSISSSGKAKLLDKFSKTTPKQSKYKWKEIGKIDETNKHKNLLLMPKNFEWDLPENFTIDISKYTCRSIVDDKYITTRNANCVKIKRYIESSYDLGYIFGTFLGDGNSHITVNKNTNCESASCQWSFGLNEINIAEKLVRCINNITDYNCNIAEKDHKVLVVNCYNKCITKLLYEFCKKENKFLPAQYYCNNIEYINGLFDGLIDSDGNIEKTKSDGIIYNLTNTSKSILELFYWCCMNLKKSFSASKCHKSIGNLKGTSIENLKDSFRIKTHTFNRFTNDYVYSEIFDINKNPKCEIVWDLEVDCETHSFIANNSIVHNSACTTRIQTGIGIPQLSCVIESAEATNEALNRDCKKAFVLSDGGITCPGDMAKAFGGGADFLMVGGEFAGHDENPGELIEENGQKYKFFYGMSSAYAMKNNYAANNNTGYRSSEGREIKIKYKGALENTVENYLGGLRSTCTYTNSRTIKELQDNCEFIYVNTQFNNNLVTGK